MNNFIDYIEASCSELKDNRMTYLYKRKLLDEMTERAQEITKAGLTDQKVISDLIEDEFGDLKANYITFEKEEKKRMLEKKLKVILPIGGLIGLIVIFAAYFISSKATGAWDKTWLIIVGGIFSMIIFYLSFAINKLSSMRRIFHPIARILVVGCVMLFSVFVFLFLLMMLPGVITWPTIPMGIILALAADLCFAFTTKQKFRTISLFVYLPAMAAMLYVILAAYSVVTWSGGWIIVFLGIVADLVYILSIIMSNMKYFMYKQEVDEE